MGTDEALEQAHATLVEGVESFRTSEGWARMLTTAARFHTYSPTNQLLIMMQRPDATRVAGYKTWQSLGRQVRKGERGISILAPIVKKLHDDAKDQDVTRCVGFRGTRVFDLAQTDGEPLSDIRPDALTGEAPEGLWDKIAAQIAGAGFTLERGDCGEAFGWTSHSQRTVRVRDNLDTAQATKTLAHELAHVLMHAPYAETKVTHEAAEVEAESVAYVVSAISGLATDTYSIPYVAGWSAADPDSLLATATRVLATARLITKGAVS